MVWISSGESFWPGINRVVISSQTWVWRRMYSRVARDRRERRLAEVLIKPLAEGLEIHIGRVRWRAKKSCRAAPWIIAGGDRHGLDPLGMAGRGHVDGVFGKDHRVVIGEGHAAGSPVFLRTPLSPRAQSLHSFGSYLANG